MHDSAISYFWYFLQSGNQSFNSNDVFVDLSLVLTFKLDNDKKKQKNNFDLPMSC